MTKTKNHETAIIGERQIITFLTPFTYVFTDPLYFEYNNVPSRTIPDQSLTIKEILERYSVGAPLDISSRDGIYNEDADFDFNDGPEDFDLTDLDLQRVRNEYIEQNKKTVNNPKPDEITEPSSDAEPQ